MPFVKLDTNILDSTLWVSDPEVRVVFISMLAMARPDGTVEATAPGIARRANISLKAVRTALTELEAPDEDSRTLAEDGRRIKRVDGGYHIVNYDRYRQKDHTSAERMRRYRARKKEQSVTRNSRNDEGKSDGVTRHVTEAYTYTEAEEEKNKSGAPNGPPPSFPRYPHAVGLQRFLDDCEAAGVKPIPEDDSAWEYAESVGIPPEFVRLAWLNFKHNWALSGGKRKKDWRLAFRNCLKNTGFGLWTLDGSSCRLTAKGKQVERQMEGE